ncbi:response regulator receiver protein [Hirschia baltica ATCC 49814]|uniref:Response regulator receiver protein n=1 Tax=Hirschia baltica (strain ATCC 49814 / DSM 5838 / IFAM 1418) TaxID=582402 RepID=C6XP97_HIRBI|nr:response regulator receiver protein [Hirschia baltica ATCC 49814]
MRETCVAPNGTVYEKFVVPKRDSKKSSVLIFSSSIEMIRMLRDMLRTSDIQYVVVSSNVEELKVKCFAYRFGTIIINDGVGIDATDIITYICDYKTSADPFVQVLFASSHCSETLMKKVVRTGYDGILSVPFSKTRL